jgi:hypothetical protein
VVNNSGEKEDPSQLKSNAQKAEKIEMNDESHQDKNDHDEYSGLNKEFETDKTKQDGQEDYQEENSMTYKNESHDNRSGKGGKVGQKSHKMGDKKGKTVGKGSIKDGKGNKKGGKGKGQRGLRKSGKEYEYQHLIRDIGVYQSTAFQKIEEASGSIVDEPMLENLRELHQKFRSLSKSVLKKTEIPSAVNVPKEEQGASGK